MEVNGLSQMVSTLYNKKIVAIAGSGLYLLSVRYNQEIE